MKLRGNMESWKKLKLFSLIVIIYIMALIQYSIVSTKTSTILIIPFYSSQRIRLWCTNGEEMFALISTNSGYDIKKNISRNKLKNIVFRHNDYQILKDIQRNLHLNIPNVMLTRLEKINGIEQFNNVFTIRDESMDESIANINYRSFNYPDIMDSSKDEKLLNTSKIDNFLNECELTEIPLLDNVTLFEKEAVKKTAASTPFKPAELTENCLSQLIITDSLLKDITFIEIPPTNNTTLLEKGDSGNSSPFTSSKPIIIEDKILSSQEQIEVMIQLKGISNTAISTPWLIPQRSPDELGGDENNNDYEVSNMDGQLNGNSDISKPQNVKGTTVVTAIDNLEEVVDNFEEKYLDHENENDPDYVPSDQSIHSDENIQTSRKEANEESAGSHGLNVSLMDRAVGTAIRNSEKVVVQHSSDGTKKNCCFYCNKFYSKLSRHLETVHREEVDVKRFAVLPKNNVERKKIIAEIRKRGNFLHNTTSSLETCNFVVSRRPNIEMPRTADYYIPCPSCKVYLSKKTAHVHVRLCTNRGARKSHSIKVLGRRLVPNVHEKACFTLKSKVLPPLRQDIVTSVVRNDELIVIYGNHLCNKYKHSAHHFKMIRAQLRLIARLLLTMKDLRDDIANFEDIFNPKFYDTFIKAVNIIGRYDQTKELYLSPKTAATIGTLISDIGQHWISECIKYNNVQKQTNAENFLKIKKANYTAEVSKTVLESQTQIRRHKKTVLPSVNDIKKLTKFLLTRRNEAHKKLQEKFVLTAWHALAETTLITIQLFNRRRPGEMERILLDDFNNYQRISKNENPEEYASLSKRGREVAKRYVRFQIRGKLGRTVSVLLDNGMLESIKMMLKYRKKARVHENNKYVFGLPGPDNLVEKHLNACQLLRRFSNECGADMPETLRGTKLRKHVATNCIALNLSSNEVTDLADFMGHHEKIHLKHYRQPLLSKDILGISKILEHAQGYNDSDCSDDENNNLENENVNGENYNKSDKNIQENELSGSSDESEYESPNKNDTSNKRERKFNIGHANNAKKRQRIMWTEEAKSTVLNAFYENMKKNNKTLHTKEIQALINSTPCLENRTVAQVRTWLHLQKSKFF
ncbi:uncharacterized protein [Prorops nasuta]|uniref:uncharacterized protein isoform X1 n=2 Tax=Prorops nasuta TaxID=863751 RepID=UPI0034CEC548